MEPIIVGAGLGILALGKWIHHSITDTRADQQRQLTRQVRQRSLQLQQEIALARERSQAVAYVDQNLAQITGTLRFSLQRLPASRSQSYLDRLNARTTAAKAQIISSANPMGTARESVSGLRTISKEAISDSGKVIHG